MLHILRLLACGEGAVLLRKHSVSLKNVQLSSFNFNVEGDGGKQRLKHNKLVMLTCPLQQKIPALQTDMLQFGLKSKGAT